MNVEAIWGNGVFRPIQPISIRHSRHTIQVPDEEIAANEPAAAASVTKPYSLPPEVAALAKAMEMRMDSIRNAPFPVGADLPSPSQKQLDRIEAFALREEIRRDR